MRQSSLGRAFAALVAFTGTLALFSASRLLAQTCTAGAGTSSPVGYQEYYVLGRESHVYNMMERVATAEGAALGTNATNSVVSAVASANGQIVYYDHWEDGLDTGLTTLPPAPVQVFATLAVTSITRAGTVATVTTPAAHGYLVNQAVQIAGAAQAPYDGTFLITAVPTATTFQYAVTGAPATPATGTITATRQSTLIFGDRNNANGRACEFTNDPRVVCGGPDEDALFDGTALTLDSDNGNGAACTTPGTWRCSVPLPRTAAALRFDGGDRIVTSGGPLSLIHNQDPLSNFIGGSVEVLSRQAYANATSYSIPAGEDLYLGNNSVTEIFQYVDVDLVAFQDNTQVTIASPGAGSVSFTLQRGQHYTNRGCATVANPCATGAIDEVTAGVPAIVINSGAKISTTAPLAGMIHTGGDGLYATDIFPILPDLLHGSDYLIPSLGDNAGVNGNRPMNLYIFNPDPVTAITVTATDTVGTRTFNVPANTTVDYFSGAAPNRFVPANSAVRLTSTANFWGLTSHDHQSPNNDWGYAWLATKFLTTSYTAGFSPGVRDPATASTPAQRTALSGDAQCTIPPPGAGTCNSINRSPLWIGATQDNTLVKIDLNGTGNGQFDYIDLDSDDCPDNGTGPNDGTCAAPINACPGFVATSCVYSLNSLQSLRVFDHTDYDNTGTVAVASKPIAMVYGQDTDQATGGDPIQDTGYTVYPTIQAFLDPVLNVDKSISPGVVPGQTGGIVTVTLAARSYGYVPITNMTLFDDLPAGSTCGNYVTNSSRITYPDLFQEIGDAATGAACTPGGGINGRDRLAWTLSHSNTLQVNQTLTVEFQVSIPAGGAGCFLNDGTARGQIGASIFEAGDQASVTRSDITLSKSVAHDGSPEPGDTLTYSVVVGNNGTNTETTVRVSDAVPAGTTFAGIGAAPPPFTAAYNAGTNTVTWSATALGLVTSLTNNGLGTATATTASPHGWSTGMTITIAGANQAEYNGSFVITNTGASTFTYAIVGTPASPATGIISARAAGPFTLTFTATINAGLPAGTVISNVAGYESTQTGYFQAAPADVTVVGPVLTRSKTGPAYLRTGEVGTFDVAVQNTGAGAATNLLINDPIPANSSYLAASMQWRLNSGPFTPLTDAPADDAGTLLAGPARVQFLLATLGANQSITFRFQVTATGATGSFISNVATVSSTQTTPADTNLVQVLISNTTLTGRLFLDLDNDGTQDPGEPGIPDIDVILTNATFGTVVASTNANGDYVASVNAPAPAGTATWSVLVDTTDPDFPTGVTLTTANNPQNVLATFGANANATAVGYRPPPLSFTKDSDAAGDVVAPGQLVNYTLTLTNNNTATTHTNITLSDTLPAGVTYVGGSASVNLPTFRVTEYYIDNAAAVDQCTEAGTDFAIGNTSCTMTLNQNLAQNYFVMIQGSGNVTTDSQPDDDHVALTGAPAGTPGVGVDLAASGAANRIVLSRVDGDSAWVGVVTVVECLRGCTTNGFTLLDVQRVAHAGATTTNTDASAVAWTDLSRVLLMGGVNGAGCTTADTTDTDHEVCHVRLTPSGTNTITWTRDATDGGLSAATSSVMAVQWGSNWTVQRTAITNGNNGGNQINVAGEYNTVAITPVTRARTWVWGTGHTNDGGAGDSAEGVALTLGNGVTQNATESTIAAGIYFAGNSINFDVYALSHPDLQVDYRFKADGDTGGGGAQTVNVTTNSALTSRMAIVSNGLDDTGDNFPRSLLSARYTANATIALERRRSRADFAAWVQGINFSRVVSPSGGAVGAPPNLLTGAEGYTLAPGETMTVTFQVQVDNPLSSSINQIANTASLCTTQTASCPGAPLTASHTDSVARVTIEPNNAGFATAGGTITFTQTVTNTGGIADSYAITVIDDITAVAWPAQLLDAATGAVIATDSNADGIWDAGTVDSGTLAAGASRTYRIRVSVPGGTAAGTENTFRLVATSDLLPAVNDTGFNEVTVVGGAAQLDVLPDNSGIAAENSFVAYSHFVINNTGATDTFDLTVAGSQGGAGWSRTIHWDTDGDGVFSDGTDLPITNTAALADGTSQLVFVRIAVPAGAAGLTDVTILTATSRNDPTRYDSATDTTTVVAASGHDLSGGGTRMVVAGDLAIFPGTIENLGPNSGDFEFTISQSSLFGGDGLNHPTQLWIDSDADGIPDLQIASDDDGDGTWDSIAAGFNDDGDAFPDVDVAGGARIAYEIRKPINAAQQVPQEFVTLTARAGLAGSGEVDSVTAQWLIAAVTRASIRGLRVDPAGVVEFATGMQRRTRSFNLYEVADEAGNQQTLLNEAEVVAPVADSLTPILYRVETRPLTQPFLMIEETETTGKRLWKGPFSITDEKLARSLERIEERLNRSGVQPGKARIHRLAARRHGQAHVRAEKKRRTASRDGVRIDVADAGLVQIPMVDLQAAGLPPNARSLRLTNMDRAVPFAVTSDPAQGQALQFTAEELATDYTGDNVYLLTWDARPFPMQVTLSRSADPLRPGFVRIERTFTYVAAAPDGNDPFLWDQLYSDGTSWPYVAWDPTGESGRFDLPELLPGTASPVAVRVRLVGTSDHRHTVEARLNSFSVGSVMFDGIAGATIVGSVPANLLQAIGNELTLVYTATLPASSQTTLDGAVYLDYVDLAAPVAPTPRTASLVALTPYDASLPAMRRVDYLIVTHPDFRDAADRIAALKEAEGLNTAVVETDNAYDRWSGGIVEARAIQALIREAASKSGRLKYVLLVGDDTFDPQDLSGFGARVFVPSLLSRDSGFGRIPSENLYADLNDDGSPELAIGRLPAQTLDEANVMADKIGNQSALLASQPDRNIFAVDNPRADDAPFRAEAEEMAALIGATPEDTAWSDIEQGTTAARAALLDAWQAGARVTHYFGHGGPEIWADEHLLTVEDVQNPVDALKPLKPTVVLMWACESQWYLNLWGPSLGEALYLVPNGGAVASFGPSGIAPPAKHRALYEKVYGSLWSAETLGEILRRAKADALADKPGNREVIDGFNLLGDPALRLPQRVQNPR